jgi:DNA-binding beta-propeller fold protein YncE/mono/diheme cytochrome c family protein
MNREGEHSMKKVLAALTLLAATLACEPAARTIEPGRGPASGAIQISRDDSRVLVASEDHGQLLVIDRATRNITFRVAVGEGAAHVIELADGTAAVTTRYGNTVAIVDVKRGELLKSIPVGVEPYGLVEVAPGKLAVALSGEDTLAIVDVARSSVDQRIALADRDPRAVALLPDGSLYVTHMATGAFSRVRLDEGRATRVDVTTRNDFGPRLVAEHLRSLTVDEDRGTVIVAHTQANVDTVRAPIGEPGSFGGNGECGYSGCQTELGAVVPGITEVDPVTDTTIVPLSASQDQLLRGAPQADCFDCGFGFGQFTPNPPSVLNPFEQRFVGTQIANPTALALFDGGRGQIMVNLGTKNAVLLRRELKGEAGDVIATVKLGNGAQSIALSHDGAFAYVWNQFDLTLSEIELPRVDDSLESSSKFVPDASGRPVASAELGIVPELAANTIHLGLDDVLTVQASIGRKMFHDATDSRISASGTVSCASCHPDGRQDGRTWQFVFGPRNTPQLGGSILDTAPFHWPGDVPTVADLNSMTVLPFMGGTGLDPASFQFVAAFIDQIRAAPSPAAIREGALTDAEARGELVFNSEATQCATCHSGAHFTDNRGYDVGTQAGFSDIRVFQTPVLHGLARSAPYLHDGSARTLEDLVNNLVRTNKMGKGSHLTDDQVADLVAYLKTL